MWRSDDDPTAITSNDLVALAFLSVPVGGVAAYRLLESERSHFNELLDAVPTDVDLVDVEAIPQPWWDVYRALHALPGFGDTRSSKLLARKRPRARPVYDSVINRSLRPYRYWEDLHWLLQLDHGALWERLMRLHRDAGLPVEVPYLRVFDVVAWMDGRRRP